MPSSRPPLPLKRRILAAALNAGVIAVRRRDGSINRRLLALFDHPVPPNPTPVNGVATSDHVIDPARGLWLRLFSPSTPPAGHPNKLPLVLYFHGGGFIANSAASRDYDGLCRRIANRVPALVASVEYRLAPEHRYPAAYDDCFDVLCWLDAATDLVPDLHDVFIAGDSAGGNIAHHVARRARNAADLRRASVAGLVAIQPFFGGETAAPSEERLDGVEFGSMKMFKWMWRLYLPVGSNRDHEAANVFGPGSRAGSEDWTGFPATMVCVGVWDPLQDRQRWYYEGLREKGVEVCLSEYPDGVHGFFIFPELPGAVKIIDDIRDFVRRRRSPDDLRSSKIG